MQNVPPMLFTRWQVSSPFLYINNEGMNSSLRWNLQLLGWHTGVENCVATYWSLNNENMTVSIMMLNALDRDRETQRGSAGRECWGFSPLWVFFELGRSDLGEDLSSGNLSRQRWVVCWNDAVIKLWGCMYGTSHALWNISHAGSKFAPLNKARLRLSTATDAHSTFKLRDRRISKTQSCRELVSRLRRWTSKSTLKQQLYAHCAKGLLPVGPSMLSA